MRVRNWAGAVVLAGYLASDLVLDPPVSSSAIFALALAEYLVLLAATRRNEAFLLAEGAALAAVDLVAMFVGTPGAGVMLLELVGAAALLLSSAAGRPLLARYARRIPLLPAEGGMIGRVNLYFGLLLMAHGAVMLAMTLAGDVSTPLAVGAFVLLYLAVMVALRRSARRDAVRNMPRLVDAGGDEMVLMKGDEELARVSLSGGRIATVAAIDVPGDRRPADVIRPLEAALSGRGCRTVRLQSWPGEDLQLEISGYHRIEGNWQKVLPVRGGRGGTA
jgi:hypothetical protein